MAHAAALESNSESHTTCSVSVWDWEPTASPSLGGSKSQPWSSAWFERPKGTQLAEWQALYRKVPMKLTSLLVFRAVSIHSDGTRTVLEILTALIIGHSEPNLGWIAFTRYCRIEHLSNRLALAKKSNSSRNACHRDETLNRVDNPYPFFPGCKDTKKEEADWEFDKHVRKDY